MNRILKRLPEHLHQYIVDQDYAAYTSQQHALWRYVMRVQMAALQNKAHASYLEGLIKTGIAVDAIPSMEEMNHKLAQIGWAAVAVDGFIPPNAFMEFQAYQVLVIASDIRTIEHILYTPAPDIIHEAAGHAPIIANPEYAEYLRRFGEIGSKAISSAQDVALYEAIRALSILKENPDAPQQAIEKAEKEVLRIQDSITELSEMAQIRNLHWWTVEYGLIGTLDNPKIYGAGLLSSLGESMSCLKNDVEKIPYSIAAAQQNFDITKPQPQLYVTPDFAHLSMVLEEFANKMAIRKGGLSGVKKLIQSESLGTVELSTGIQISGVFSRVIYDNDGKIWYVQTRGKTALASRNKELIAHGTSYHSDGFGSPVGKLKGINLAIEDMYPSDLEAYGIYEGKDVVLDFAGGIQVKGTIITGVRNLQGKIQLISFRNCTVTYRDEILFQPEWGVYDMAVGKRVLSAYAGPADPHSFLDVGNKSPLKTPEKNYSDRTLPLYDYYQMVRNHRESGTIDIGSLQEIFVQIQAYYPEEWLLLLELYELVKDKDSRFADTIHSYLQSIASNPVFEKLIRQGLRLI